MGEPGGLPSMGSHRVRHDLSNLAAAAAHASKAILKILQAKLQQHVNRELPDVQSGFIFFFFNLVLEKAKETEIKLPTSVGSSKNQENSRKTSSSASLTMLKPLTVYITTSCGKFL